MGRGEGNPYKSVKSRSVMYRVILIMVLIIQWNARSLLANGQFKHFLNELDEKPDVVCVQETWLKPNLEFKLHGYTGIRRDRNTGEGGGGCAIFIKTEIPYRILEIGEEQEYIVMEGDVG